MRKYNLTALIALGFIAQATQTLGSGWFTLDEMMSGTEESEAAPPPPPPPPRAPAVRVPGRKPIEPLASGNPNPLNTGRVWKLLTDAGITNDEAKCLVNTFKDMPRAKLPEIMDAVAKLPMGSPAQEIDLVKALKEEGKKTLRTAQELERQAREAAKRQKEEERNAKRLAEQDEIEKKRQEENEARAKRDAEEAKTRADAARVAAEARAAAEREEAAKVEAAKAKAARKRAAEKEAAKKAEQDRIAGGRKAKGS